MSFQMKAIDSEALVHALRQQHALLTLPRSTLMAVSKGYNAEDFVEILRQEIKHIVCRPGDTRYHHRVPTREHHRLSDIFLGDLEFLSQLPTGSEAALALAVTQCEYEMTMYGLAGSIGAMHDVCESCDDVVLKIMSYMDRHWSHGGEGWDAVSWTNKLWDIKAPYDTWSWQSFFTVGRAEYEHLGPNPMFKKSLRYLYKRHTKHTGMLLATKVARHALSAELVEMIADYLVVGMTEELDKKQSRGRLVGEKEVLVWDIYAIETTRLELWKPDDLPPMFR